jgi:hypothetical protein
MIVIKWVWFLIGCLVSLQYLYWAVLEIGYGLSLNDAPVVTHGWIFLAFVGVVIAAGDRLGPELKNLLGGRLDHLSQSSRLD